MISTILLVAAFILFLLAAVGIPSGRVNLIAAGLACWSLAQILGRYAPMVIAALLFTGCSIELHADGTKKLSVSPTAADYKAVRSLGR